LNAARAGNLNGPDPFATNRTWCPPNPHYRDLYELWARGKYFPVFFSRAKVESVAEKIFTLAPQ
jgi:hypothetical protein